MTKISLIAVIDEAFGIGNKNRLLVHMPADLKYFKSVTMGKPIIMGRHTYESIGKPLPGRKNIIISTTLTLDNEVTIVPSLEHALKLTAGVPEVMIIGGAQIFTQAIHQADRLYITKIHHHFTADVYFPNIDTTVWECKEWRLQKKDEQNPFDMTFSIYERTNKL